MTHKPRFEIQEKDLAARIGELTIGEKKIETPTIMPVVNPKNKKPVSTEELQEKFGAQVLMTNAYILMKNEKLKNEVLDKGIHEYLGFDGLLATDSGSFQLMEYGNVLTTNEEVISFQNEIGSDIGSFLDVPTPAYSFKPRAKEQLEMTIERAKEASEKAQFVVNAGIQGSTHLDLRKKSAEETAPYFQLCAVGGIVGIMESYQFGDLVDIIATVKKNIPNDRVVHAFGLGHPMAFSLAAALGCDLFDSAAYALYAQQDRYLTEYGTKRVNELEYLPCSCPICEKHGIEMKELPKEERITALARHNLHVTYAELGRVKQAIREGSLFDLLSVRLRSHPHLLTGLEHLLEHREWISSLDKITRKSAFFVLGEETEKRPEAVNFRKRIQRVKSENLHEIPSIGKVPMELMDMYPFVSVTASEKRKGEEMVFKAKSLDKVRAMADYQFGKGAGRLIPEKADVKKSKKTKRMRWIYYRNELIASLRASDNWIIPKEFLARKLKEEFEYPRLRLVIDDEAKPFVADGKSAFCKFVLDVDPELRCMDEALVVDKNDELIRIGTLHLSPREIMDFERGMAARVR